MKNITDILKSLRTPVPIKKAIADSVAASASAPLDTMIKNPIGTVTSGSYVTTLPTTIASYPTVTMGSTAAQAGSILTSSTSTWVSGGGNGMMSPSWGPSHPWSVSNNSKELVRIETDGKVVWADDVKIDEAAERFKTMVQMSLEMKAGIIEKTKQNIRDTLFGEIINIAKEKGSLTADELTLILEATKIMEKLKG